MTMRILALVVLTISCSAFGQVHVGDFLLTVEGNKVVVNVATGGGGYVPERVFRDRFGKLGPGLPNRTPDPGFNSVVGEFVAGQPVGLTIRRAARLWTPPAMMPGDGDFCTMPEERIEVRKNGIIISTPATDPAGMVGPSLEIGTSDPIDGQFHEHAVYWLTTPFDAGVYLLEMEVWVGQPGGVAGGVGRSDALWLVLNQNAATTDVDDAVAWLRANVANVVGDGGPLCPAPAPVCACDWNQSGALSVQDIFDFLSSYFGGAGDFNGQGGATVQDIFDFLTCYFGAC